MIEHHRIFQTKLGICQNAIRNGATFQIQVVLGRIVLNHTDQSRFAHLPIKGLPRKSRDTTDGADAVLIGMAHRVHRSAFCGGAHRTNPLLFSFLAARIGCGDPTAINMVVVVFQMLPQQNVFQRRSHHLMSGHTGMGAIAAKLVDRVILFTIIVQAADYIQIDHRHVIQRAYLDDRVAEVPQGVSVNICLALIPIPHRGNRIVPGGDHRCQEIELRFGQRFRFAQFHDPLAPHMHRAIDCGGVGGVNGSKRIITCSCLDEVIDSDQDRHHICPCQIAFCQLAYIAGRMATGAKCGSADTQANVFHAQGLGQQRHIVRLIPGDTDTIGNAVTNTSDGLPRIRIGLRFAASGADAVLVAMSQSIRVAVHITVPADGAGMGGVAAFGAGGRGHDALCRAMGHKVPVFIHAIDRISLRHGDGEGIIGPVQPVQSVNLVPGNLGQAGGNHHTGAVCHQAVQVGIVFIIRPHGLHIPGRHAFRNVHKPVVPGRDRHHLGHILTVKDTIPAGVIGVVLLHRVSRDAGVAVDGNAEIGARVQVAHILIDDIGRILHGDIFKDKGIGKHQGLDVVIPGEAQLSQEGHTLGDLIGIVFEDLTPGHRQHFPAIRRVKDTVHCLVTGIPLRHQEFHEIISGKIIDGVAIADLLNPCGDGKGTALHLGRVIQEARTDDPQVLRQEDLLCIAELEAPSGVFHLVQVPIAQINGFHGLNIVEHLIQALQGAGIPAFIARQGAQLLAVAEHPPHGGHITGLQARHIHRGQRRCLGSGTGEQVGHIRDPGGVRLGQVHGNQLGAFGEEITHGTVQERNPT